jgi:hypothetical protein
MFIDRGGHMNKALNWASIVACTISLSASIQASTSSDAPTLTPDGRLIRPLDYREWILIGTGLGMAYGPARDQLPAGERPFTNVFVNPSSYRAFLTTGQWPDRTIFVLEIRSSTAVNNAPGGANGVYQGELLAIEAEVKDESRFGGEWAFFSLSMTEPAGQQIPQTASCYECHSKNAAVENTFVQFYPVLREVAREKGTFKKVPEVF